MRPRLKDLLRKLISQFILQSSDLVLELFLQILHVNLTHYKEVLAVSVGARRPSVLLPLLDRNKSNCYNRLKGNRTWPANLHSRRARKLNTGSSVSDPLSPAMTNTS